MKKTAFVTALVLSANMAATAFAGFYDMNSHWSAAFVNKLAETGIVSGDSGAYRPDSYITAAEFVKMTVCALGYKPASHGAYWAAPYIDYALESELLWDNEIADFSASITRGQAAMILVRAAGLEYSPVSNQKAYIREIDDYYDITNDYKPYVLRAYANNLIKGYGDKTFRYKSYLTRGEAAVLITRLLTVKPLEGEDMPVIEIDAGSAYYVSPDGNDANDGSAKSPFGTIGKARDKVREIIAAGAYPDGGITVYLRGGDYALGETLYFDEGDSGTENAPVKYMSYPGEVANITGSVKLDYSKFTNVSSDIAAKLQTSTAKEKVLQYNLAEAGITELGQISRRGYLISAGITPQAELYVDSRRMQLSRWPNDGWAGTSGIVRSGARSQKGVLEGAVYKIDYTQPTKWKTNINEIYTSGVLGPNYFYGYFPIEKIENGQITLKEGSVTDYYSKHFIRYENILEETDAPGEYYIDRTTGMLYFYPTAGFGAETDIRLSYLPEHLIKMENTKNLVLENLIISNGRANGIRATGIENITVKNCEVGGIGTDGIYMSGTNNTVRSCYIHDIGSHGINMNGGDYEHLISGGNVIENNHIEKAGQLQRSYYAGVLLGHMSVGAQVRYNKIHDMPHTAVIIYGPEHIFEYNEVYDAVQEFHDMDAIYLNVYQFPWERGVMIKNNYIHDFGNKMFTEKQMNVAGIRTDNQGNGLNVIGNIFYNIGSGTSNGIRGVCAEGTDNVINNNMFIDVADTYDGPDTYRADAKWDVTSNTVKGVYAEWQKYNEVYSAKYPEVATYFNRHYASYVDGNKFNNNLIVNIKVPISTTNGGINSFGFRANEQLVESEGNYITKQDPGFVDYANGNFNLKNSSEVFTKIPGFEKIDFSKIGNIEGETVGVQK